MSQSITVQATVKAPIDKVWKCWVEPEHIKKWAFASDDWEAPSAVNNLWVGGKFITRMQAKDGSFGFDFGGTYDAVVEHRLIEYTIGDGRKVIVRFEETPEGVKVTETFDAEKENTEDKQREGWQAIMDNFKKHTESF